MSLDPRAIAVQGVGYSPRFLALQGLVPVSEVQVTIIGGGAARHPIRFPIPRKRREEEEELMILIAMALERMH